MRRKIIVFCGVLVWLLQLQLAPAKPGFVMHKVVKGESLYQIGKKYQVTVDDLLKNNPGVTAANLKPGMILRVPSKNVPAPPKPAVQPVSPPKKQQNHIVLPKETLYGIAKKYGVTIEQIKTWNDLDDNSLQEGQVLVINPAPAEAPKKPETPAPVTVTEKPVQAPTPVKPVIPVNEELPSDLSPEANLSLATLSKKFLAQQKSGTPTTLKGTADLMASSSPASNATTYFAMHKTAPVGSILKIKNLENSKVTYAKVIGKLPELEENKYVLVRVSQGVAKALGMGYGKAYVEMTFAQ